MNSFSRGGIRTLHSCSLKEGLGGDATLCRHGIVENALGVGLGCSHKSSHNHNFGSNLTQALQCSTQTLTSHPSMENIFEVDANKIKFGYNALNELGNAAAKVFGLKRVALVTDTRVRQLAFFQTALDSLKEANVDVVVYDEVLVEPTEKSLQRAAQFAAQANVDGFVSLGGGSVIDTCKAANLYSSCPTPDFLDYVNPPVGKGKPINKAYNLKKHISCPTTSGTGSESTGIIIFDLLEQHIKTGIVSRFLRPDMAVIDPIVTDTMSSNVIACSGFDMLSHAIESYTARPFNQTLSITSQGLEAHQRPLGQGSNPWSDIGCVKALEIVGKYFKRSVLDPSDREARYQMLWASTLSGISFGNSGVHIPHGMSYSVAGMVKEGFVPKGYVNPKGDIDAGHLLGIVPHGMSVILNAPATFRYTSNTSPERHLECAKLLGAETRGAESSDAGEVLGLALIQYLRDFGFPNGLNALGYGKNDIVGLVDGAWKNQRLLKNGPMDVTKKDLEILYKDAMSYW